jgi:uncharacterized protein YndB with AHSA1/START domain
MPCYIPPDSFEMEKVEFQVDVMINASKGSLFSRLTTPSGLSEWFADDVNIKKDVFTFFWEGADEQARLLTQKRDEFVKFRWIEHEEEDLKTYFEIRIKIDALTGDTVVSVIDFADEDEVEEAKLLWEKQLGDLKRVLGG